MFTKIKTFLFFLSLAGVFFGQPAKELDLKLAYKSLPFGLKSFQSEYTPKVALALSGGGARGIAQLGVLKAIEESGIELSEIVGTSMGSIIGGLYSAGYTLDELDTLILKAPWAEFFSIEEVNRRELFLDQKITEDKAIIALRLDAFQPVIPTAINTGQRVANYLNLLSLNAPLNTTTDFANLLFPFKAVSTNLVTGEPYVWKEGTLGIAMRASSSVSLVLEPVRMDTLILVDGGLVANVPVKTAKESGADYVVAIDVTSPLRTREELRYPWEIADQLVSIPMRLINEDHVKNADMVLYPKVRQKKNNDFTDLRQLIDDGYESTKNSLQTLQTQLELLARKKLEPANLLNENLIIQCNDNDLSNYLNSSFEESSQISEEEIIYAVINYENIDDFKSIKVIIDSTLSHLSVDVELNPIIENIIVVGAELVDADSIVAESFQLKDYPFNSKRLLQAFLNMLREYRNHGFSLVRIEKYSFEDGVLKVFIDEQRIDEIIVEGNSKTKKEVITRELPFKEGDVFIRREIEEGLANLRSTGLFENIELKIEQKGNRNILAVEVKEKPSMLLRFGLRLDNEYFTQPSIDIREENLMGSGTEVGAVFTGGLRNQFLSLEHRANRVFNTYLTYKVKVFYDNRDINTYQNDSTDSENRFSRSRLGEYTQSYLGGSIGVGAQFQKYGNIIAEGRYQRDRISAKENFSTNDEYTTNIATLKFQVSIDSQNEYPFPTQGVLLTGYYETAQTAFGGDVGYSKFSLDYKNYFSLSNLHTLSLKFKIGFGDETLPLSQQFSFGGQNNFYGYRDYEYRGRQIFISSLEYRIKLPLNLLFDTYLKGRYDIGSIWSQQQDIRFKDLRHGIGASLAFDTPIGPAEFSVGKSFLLKNVIKNNIISWGETLFYFTIGYYY